MFHLPEDLNNELQTQVFLSVTDKQPFQEQLSTTTPLTQALFLGRPEQ